MDIIPDLSQPNHRVCNKCRVEKPLEEFWKRPTGKYGRRSACIKCLTPAWTQYRKDSLARLGATHREQELAKRAKVGSHCCFCGFSNMIALRIQVGKGSKKFLSCLNCAAVRSDK
jgi:hypothetical protein